MSEKLYESFTSGENATINIESSGDISGQTFTTGASGEDEIFLFTKAKFRLFKTGSPVGSARIIVTTTSGAFATGNIIGEGTLDVTTLGTSPAWTSISLTTPPKLSRSTRYYVGLSAGDLTTINGNNSVNLRQNNVDTYDNGERVTSSDYGQNYTTGAGDLMFQIFGHPWTPLMCDHRDIMSKAGKNVLSTLNNGINVDLVEKYALRAESFVNIATRKNWSDVYSTLNSDVKYILNDLVSSLAAIDCIQYDMSGYTTRTEAEDMINILRDGILRNLSLLRDKKTEDFVTGA